VSLDPEAMTWTCHVCGEERPDAQISVLSTDITPEGQSFSMRQNVRYCNDRLSCITGASLVRFVK
jgi:hypothetical protein